MKTTQAWGWLTAGVLALGLNGVYHDAAPEWAHEMFARVAGNSVAVLALASGRAEQFLTQAQNVAAHNKTPQCRWSAAMARMRARQARQEFMSARQQAEMSKMQCERARMEIDAARLHFAEMNFRDTDLEDWHVPVVNPKVRVVIPTVNLPTIKVPVVRVDVSGAGPV